MTNSSSTPRTAPTTPPTPLQFVSVPLSMQALGRWAADRRYGWAIRKKTDGGGASVNFDEGRALHHLLSEMFGSGAFQPFNVRIPPGSDRGVIYAYARTDLSELLETARACAAPETLEIVDLNAISFKDMPAAWESGRRYGFEVRIKPIRRLSKPLLLPNGKTMPKGAEIDAYVLEGLRGAKVGTVLTPDTKVFRDRQAVYSDWLAEKLKDAARLGEDIRLAHYRRHLASRMTAGVEGPDAVIQGTLEVTNPLLFSEVLASGVGRHCAYGFGMLLLRPAAKVYSPC